MARNRSGPKVSEKPRESYSSVSMLLFSLPPTPGRGAGDAGASRLPIQSGFPRTLTISLFRHAAANWTQLFWRNNQGLSIADRVGLVRLVGYPLFNGKAARNNRFKQRFFHRRIEYEVTDYFTDMFAAMHTPRNLHANGEFSRLIHDDDPLIASEFPPEFDDWISAVVSLVQPSISDPSDALRSCSRKCVCGRSRS